MKEVKYLSRVTCWDTFKPQEQRATLSRQCFAQKTYDFPALNTAVSLGVAKKDSRRGRRAFPEPHRMEPIRQKPASIWSGRLAAAAGRVPRNHNFPDYSELLSRMLLSPRSVKPPSHVPSCFTYSISHLPRPHLRQCVHMLSFCEHDIKAMQATGKGFFRFCRDNFTVEQSLSRSFLFDH